MKRAEDAMFAVNPGKADRSTGQLVNHFGGTFLGQLASMTDRLDPWRLFRPFQDEARRNATFRELNLLSDHDLDDVGVRRSVDRRADDLVKRLRLGG
jgi:uncharacterized protein YjiS (DUF1127 family)